MRLLTHCLMLFGFICLTTVALATGPGQSKTPGSNVARLEEPWLSWLPVHDDVETALTHQGYTFEWHGNPDTAFFPNLPDPTLTEWVADIGASAGAFYHAGHALSSNIAIEVYPHTTRGKRLAQERCQYYLQHGYVYPEIWLFEDPYASEGWAVGLSWAGVASRCSFNDAVVDIEACCSASSMTWTGARVAFVNSCDLTDLASALNIEAIWGGLDGQAPEADKWRYRTASWAATNASQFCQMRPEQTDGGHTTLAPCVKWTDATPNGLIPPGGLSVKVLFDAHVDQTGDPCLVWRADGGVFTLDGAAWQGDTLLSVIVDPISNSGENRTGTLVVQKDLVRSLSCANLHLDGDAVGGPSDWTVDLRFDDAPAAQIDGVDWKDGVFTWDVVTEFNTAGYRIEGNTPPDETWHSIGDSQPPGVGKRSIEIGNAYALYRVVEVENSGHEFIGNCIGSVEKVMPQLYLPRSFEDLVADYQRNLETPPEQGQCPLLNGEKLLVIAPLAWMGTIAPLLNYMNANYGVQSMTLPTENFGTPIYSYWAIKASIAAWYESGYRYVLLGGDASDYRYFATGGQFTTEYWGVGNWETIRLQYINSGYPASGDPSNLIIPAKVIKDQRPRYQGVAYFRPYYELGDAIAYGDVDGDSLPDMAVGRWPCDNLPEWTSLCNKTLTYFQVGNASSQPFRTNVFLGDVAHGGGPGVDGLPEP